MYIYIYTYMWYVYLHIYIKLYTSTSPRIGRMSTGCFPGTARAGGAAVESASGWPECVHASPPLLL